MSVSVTDHKIRLRATVSVLPLRWKMIQPEQLGPEHIDNHFTAVFTLLLLLLFNSKIIILNEKKKCDSHVTGRPSIWPELYITSCLHCRLVAITVWGRSGINWLVSFTEPGPCFGEHLNTLGASWSFSCASIGTCNNTFFNCVFVSIVVVPLLYWIVYLEVAGLKSATVPWPADWRICQSAAKVEGQQPHCLNSYEGQVWIAQKK